MWWLARKVGWKVVTVVAVTLTGVATRRILEKAVSGPTPPKAAADSDEPPPGLVP